MAGPSEVLAGLRDVRPPDIKTPEMVADGFLVAAIGLALALVVALLLRPLTRGIRTSREIALDELAVIRGLPIDQRVVAQAKLVRRFAEELELPAELVAKLRRHLYERDTDANAEQLEQELKLLLGQLR